jgi:hypothetical protein
MMNNFRTLFVTPAGVEKSQAIFFERRARRYYSPPVDVIDGNKL